MFDLGHCSDETSLSDTEDRAVTYAKARSDVTITYTFNQQPCGVCRAVVTGRGDGVDITYSEEEN